MRRRIVVLAVLTAAVATALFGVPLAVAAARSVHSDERVELERLADSAAVSVAADVVHGREPAELPTAGSETRLGLYDPTGRRTAGRGPGTDDGSVRAAERGTLATATVDGQQVVAVPITDNNRVVGVVRAATSSSEATRQIAQSWALMLGLGALAVAITWLLARRQAVRLARPLQDLSVAARRLGDGDFAVRTHRSGIPEVDETGEALNSTAGRLDGLVSRERAFASDVSHQLRTPLTGLRLGLETALEDPREDARAAIMAALVSTDRLDRTIDDLLALNREGSRGGSPMDPGVLLAELQGDWSPVLHRHGRRLDIRRDPELPVSTASPAAIRQVLAVLLDNACAHGAGTVTVTVRDAGQALAIDVSDDGPDIELESERMFTRRARQLTSHDPAYFVGQHTADSAGHGIGLALARALAEAEGGRLELTRRTPPTFTLILPAGAEPTPAGPAPA